MINILVILIFLNIQSKVVFFSRKIIGTTDVTFFMTFLVTIYRYNDQVSMKKRPRITYKPDCGVH